MTFCYVHAVVSSLCVRPIHPLAKFVMYHGVSALKGYFYTSYAQVSDLSIICHPNFPAVRKKHVHICLYICICMQYFSP